MYLTKKVFIEKHTSAEGFLVQKDVHLVLALDNEFFDKDSQITLMEGSNLELLLINDKPTKPINLNILQQKNSSLKVLIINSADNYNLDLRQQTLGPNCQFKAFGTTLNYGHSDSKIKIQSHLKHNNCQTFLSFKNVLQNHSKVDFFGLIEVSQEAENCDAFLENKNLLENSNCRLKTEPILQIYNPIVKAKHAATTGFLNTGQLFYLGSRGLNPDQAKHQLVLAFCREILKEVNILCYNDRFREILD